MQLKRQTDLNSFYCGLSQIQFWFWNFFSQASLAHVNHSLCQFVFLFRMHSVLQSRILGNEFTVQANNLGSLLVLTFKDNGQKFSWGLSYDEQIDNWEYDWRWDSSVSVLQTDHSSERWRKFVFRLKNHCLIYQKMHLTYQKLDKKCIPVIFNWVLFLSSSMSADGQSMWASVQKEPPPREPDYGSIEELFCLPVTEPKDKGAAAPVKKEPKEVEKNFRQNAYQHKWLKNIDLFPSICYVDNIRWSKEKLKYEHIPETV